MTEPATRRASTQVSRTIKAPRASVYRACLDPRALATWRAPDNMQAQVHEFDAREGGTYRMSLTYQNLEHSPGGKTSNDTDTFRGRFVELVAFRKIVEEVEFEAPDPAFSGQMRITTSLADTGEGTEVTILCQEIPVGIRPEDNEIGCQSSLRNLAALLE
jgi:uncharacterized protein YndB with AHSA1/START domain